MEKKKLFAILYLYTVALNQLQTSSTAEIFSASSSFVKNGCMHADLQYEMLMEFERHKLKLVNSLKRDEVYTDLYVIQTNDSHKMKYISGKHGFTVIRKVFKDENYYLLNRFNSGKQRRSTENIFHNHKKSSEIRWTARQFLKDRVQRFLLPQNMTEESQRFFRRSLLRKSLKKPPIYFSDFNDPLFNEQWYLHNSGQTGTSPENDINVLPVWRSGITGRGVAIAVLDDGVFRKSEEVADNYDVASSEEYLYLNTNHSPVPENSHGTYCAAIAAGVANNGVCGVGVAYEARIGGVRILDGPLTDVQEALALVHALDHVDIYTASWGPTDDGRHIDGPGFLTRIAFLKGVTTGRKGKGSIYVWAAGNGGTYQDNCALDGYASSPFTLTIGALTQEGRSAYYSEPCAAVIASVYVGGSFHTPPSPLRRLMEQAKIKVVVPEGRGKCRETFQGTSAAAPMAAGVVALALQANSNLTWRDIQHIVIRTSRVPPTNEDGWVVNAAGFTFHPKLGSGVLDANALVELGRSWKTVEALHVWTSPAYRTKRLFLPREDVSIPFLVQKSEMQTSHRVDRLETVIVTLRIQHNRCGDLRLVLESPSGTPSTILTRRPFDNKTTNFSYWDFVSIHFWGEDPEGRWTLRISNRHGSVAGFLDYLTITLYGTEHKNTDKQNFLDIMTFKNIVQ